MGIVMHLSPYVVTWYMEISECFFLRVAIKYRKLLYTFSKYVYL